MSISAFPHAVYVAAKFIATADKSLVESSGSGAAACGTVGSTDSVTVTPENGVAPYTYSWARVGAAAQYGPWVCNSPTSNVTSFSAPGSVCDPASPTTETWRCTVTDNVGREVTVDVDVRIRWTNTT